MAQVEFSVGDQFEFEHGTLGKETGFGIVLPDNMALVIRGEGGRFGRTVTREKIPERARPVTENRGPVMAHEVKLALDAVGTALFG